MLQCRVRMLLDVWCLLVSGFSLPSMLSLSNPCESKSWCVMRRLCVKILWCAMKSFVFSFLNWRFLHEGCGITFILFIVTNKLSSLFKARILSICTFLFSWFYTLMVELRTLSVFKYCFVMKSTEINDLEKLRDYFPSLRFLLCPPPAHALSLSPVWLGIRTVSLTDKRSQKFKAPHKTLLPPFSSTPPQPDTASCLVREGRHTQTHTACDNTRPQHNVDAKLRLPVAAELRAIIVAAIWPLYDVALLFNPGIITL